MVRLKIPHEYIERPGKHDWAYWRNAVEYQLLFLAIILRVGNELKIKFAYGRLEKKSLCNAPPTSISC